MAGPDLSGGVGSGPADVPDGFSGAAAPVGQGADWRPRSLPLWAHALLLACALTAIWPLTRPGHIFFSDEGGYGAQAQLLAGGRWVLTPTLPGIDPAATAQPFGGADVGTRGRAPYARHAAYPLLLAPFYRWGGVPGLLIPSMAGTVLAALGAAVLAGRLRRRAARPTLWLLGLGSPLFFDAYWVLAHSLAAAAAAGAAVALLSATASPLESSPTPDRSGLPRRRWLPGGRQALALGAAATCIAALVLLRSEGVVVAGAVVVACSVLFARTRSPAWLLSAAATVAGAVAGRVVDLQLRTRAVGSAVAVPPVPAGTGGGFLRDRLQAFQQTIVESSYDSHVVKVVLLVGVAALAAAAVSARRHGDWRPVAVFGGVAVVAEAIWLVAGHQLVPGLLPAFPLLAAGLVLVRRDLLRTTAGLFLAVAGGVAGAGILGSEYYFGGGVEWGGRFFAVGLPLVAPLAVAAVVDPGPKATPAARRALLVAVTGAGLVLSAAAVGALVHFRAIVATADAVVARAAASAGPAPVGDHRTVVVTTKALEPQLVWPEVERYQMLAPEPAVLGTILDRLQAAGVPRLVLLTTDPARDLTVSGGHRWLVASSRRTGTLQVVVLTSAGAG